MILIDVMPLLYVTISANCASLFLPFGRLGSHHAQASKWVEVVESPPHTGYTIRSGSVAAVCIYLNYFFADTIVSPHQ